MISQTMEGISASASSGTERTRRRLPRHIAPDGILRAYKDREARGLYLLHQLDSGARGISCFCLFLFHYLIFLFKIAKETFLYIFYGKEGKARNCLLITYQHTYYLRHSSPDRPLWMFPCRYFVRSVVTRNPDGLSLILRKGYSQGLLAYATGSPSSRQVHCEDRRQARQLREDLSRLFRRIKQTKDLKVNS